MQNIKIYTKQTFFSLHYHNEQKAAIKHSFNQVYPVDMNHDEFLKAIEEYHSHDHLEIFIFLGNQCYFHIEEDEYTLYKGDILVIPAYCVHRLISEKGINNSRFIINIPFNLFSQFVELQPHKKDKFTKYFETPGHYRLKISSLNEILDYFFKILDCIDQPLVNVNFKTAYYLSRAIEHLFDAPKIPQIDGTFSNDRHFSHIIYYIDQHFTEPNLQLERITQEFQISPYYFSKLFKKEMNRNFHEYLVEKRVEHAAYLMQHNEENKLTLQEIADVSGFGDYSTFYRGFRKHYAISPKKFAQQVENNAADTSAP